MAENRKTLPEQLDAAKDGQEFGNALMGFFAAMDRARFSDDEEEEEDSED